MDNDQCDSINPQILLKNGFDKRNIRDFCAALKLGANPLERGDMEFSVFEQALKTRGCVDFVKECLDIGCVSKYPHIQTERDLLRCAIAPMDPQILKTFLEKLGSTCHINEENILISFTRRLNRRNITNAYWCIKISLEYGAPPNIECFDGITPLHRILDKKDIDDLNKKQLIQLFLARPDIEIDTFQGGNLRKILQEKYPDLELPEIRKQDLITCETLMKIINEYKFDAKNTNFKFEEYYKHNLRKTSPEENQELICAAIEKGYHLAFNHLMTDGIDFSDANCVHKVTKAAVDSGNWFALERLLEQPYLNLEKQNILIINLIGKLDRALQEYQDYWKCFELLLQSDKMDVNSFDHSKNTALHLAVRYHNSRAIKDLLKRGADICVKNNANELAIEGMSPKVLEEHLNDCITSYTNHMSGKTNESITINFQNFMPENTLFPDEQDVMTPIAFIAHSQEYCQLLQHPVITTILFLKWHRISLIFYINCFFYLVHALSIIVYVVFKFRETDYESAETISAILSWIGTIYLILRESLQFILGPVRYIISANNYVELALIICSVMTCIGAYDDATQRYIAVFTILLTAVELSFIVGYFPIPSLSTHILMLKAVWKSFWESFLLYLNLVIAFAISFYIIHDDNQTNDHNDELESDNNEILKNNGSDSELRQDQNGTLSAFPDLLVAFTKTIVMLTGELDAGHFEFNSYYSYLIFVLFACFITLILFNLLNGLAVSDTQAIQNRKKINYLICRTDLLVRYRHVKSLEKHSLFRAILKYWQYLYPDCVSKIVILPYENNKILIPKPLNQTIIAKEGLDTENDAKPNNSVPLIVNGISDMHDPITFLPCCFSCITNKCTEMDNSTVTSIVNILEQKKIENRLILSQTIDTKLEKLEIELLQSMDDNWDEIKAYITSKMENFDNRA